MLTAYSLGDLQKIKGRKLKNNVIAEIIVWLDIYTC
jgi:hypothetical protein